MKDQIINQLAKYPELSDVIKDIEKQQNVIMSFQFEPTIYVKFGQVETFFHLQIIYLAGSNFKTVAYFHGEQPEGFLGGLPTQQTQTGD